MAHGIVSNLQRYSVHDGPGIRTTVFLKGCPLDCWWCHNPENRDRAPELWVRESRCVRCGACVQVCPEMELEVPLAPEAPPPRPGSCQLCGACLAACVTGARQLVGRRMSTAEVMAEVLRDRLFYEESGGGVTISGGEPLTQAAFVTELLDACRARGVSTALDTCGYAPTGTFLAVAGKAGLVLFDLKHLDDARHRQWTGVSNQLILANLQALDAAHPRIWARVPLIPGVNDEPEHLAALGRLLGGLRHVRQINVLPYHPTGAAKFARLGAAYRLPGVVPPTPEQLARAVEQLQGAGLPVKIGG